MSDVSDEKLWSWVDREAPELAEHLQRHPSDERRVDEIRDALGLVQEGAPKLGAFRAPERIGPYRLVRLLGEGGMGVVYEARQETPRRDVALKLVRTVTLADEVRVDRFRREANALARLRHPSIATIFEAGESEEGTPYIAMELVDGMPLDRYVEAHSLRQRAKLELFREICAAVAHAHDQGVVHRDLKPQNILVTNDGTPKVLDFGLAQIGDSERSHLVTEPGHVLGTLAYMSPEQVRAVRDELSSQTDVYSLGVILYELLTGSLPHDVADVSLPEAARRICEEPARRPRSIHKRFDRDLEAILLKALEADLSARYSEVSELSEDLERFLDGAPVRARRSTLGRRVRKFLARHKLAAALTLLIGLLIASTAYGALILSPGLVGPLAGGGFPTVSPFDSMRFNGPVPEVEVDGRWYELIEIDGKRAGILVQQIQAIEGDRWKWRITEDLWEALFRTGDFPGFRADLVLRDLETGERVELDDVRMTHEKRQRIRARRHEMLGMRLYFRDGELRLSDDSGRQRVLSIGDLDGRRLEEVLAERELSASDLVTELVTHFEGHRAGAPLTVRLDDGSGGVLREVRVECDASDRNAPLIPRATLEEIHERVRQR